MEFYNASIVAYALTMFLSHPSLLTRLRRHRGLWVLAVAVLLIKLAAGTMCLTDGPYKNIAASTASALSIDAPSEQSVTSAADEAGDCVLGEAGDCHCACAHTLPLPTVASLSVARMEMHFDALAIHSGFLPATTGSLLRPPIA
ncbi:hypothetical protein [Rhodanobacter sp. BL-MT-08]